MAQSAVGSRNAAAVSVGLDVPGEVGVELSFGVEVLPLGLLSLTVSLEQAVIPASAAQSAELFKLLVA